MRRGGGSCLLQIRLQDQQGSSDTPVAAASSGAVREDLVPDVHCCACPSYWCALFSQQLQQVLHNYPLPLAVQTTLLTSMLCVTPPHSCPAAALLTLKLALQAQTQPAAVDNVVHAAVATVLLQARETLKLALQAQIQQKQEALDQLKQRAGDARAKLLAITQKLAAVGGDAAESMPRQQPTAAAAVAMEEG